MRRYCIVACMALVVFLFVACSRRGSQGGPKETAFDNAVSQGGISGDAIVMQQMKLSDSEAFSLAEEVVQGMTLEEKVAQMLLIDVSALTGESGGAASGGPKVYELSDDMRKQLISCPVGGIYLTENNMSSREQARKFIRDLQSCVSGSALYIAVEEEGGGAHSVSGKVKDLRVGGYIMPADIGNSMSKDQIRSTAGKIAEELRDWGINMNLAPVADLASSKNADYERRCFSKDSAQVSQAVSSFVKGMGDQALGTTLKYFPGVGNVSGDYTQKILKNTDSLMTLRDKNFAVYAAGIKAGTDCIMVSNVAVPKVTVDDNTPAFLSDVIVTSVLRQELDFEGVIMTSPLNLPVLTKNYKQDKLAVDAVRAGCDMLVMPADYRAAYQGLLTAVRDKKIDEKAINTSVRRIIQDKIQRGIYVLENN